MRAVHTPRSWTSPQESKATRRFVGTQPRTQIHGQHLTIDHRVRVRVHRCVDVLKYKVTALPNRKKISECQ